MSTIEYYNKNSKDYFDSTVNVDMSASYEEFINLLPKGSKILDLGCGSGRDSLQFMKLGYDVTAVDGSLELAKRAAKLLGKEVIVISFEELQLEDKYDGIWACASLLHLDNNALRDVLNKLYDNLNDSGIFYMSFKYGTSEFIDKNNRYFNMFTDERLIKFIEENTKYNILQISGADDSLGRINEVKWINVLCKK